jgi:hypothetical protein
MVRRSRRKQRFSRRGGRRSFKSLFRRRRTRRRNNNNSYNKPKKVRVYADPTICEGLTETIAELKKENNLLKKQVEILLNQQKKNTSVSAYYNDNELYY